MEGPVVPLMPNSKRRCGKRGSG